MGREIRKVPANWNHPKYTEHDAPHPSRIGNYRGLLENYQRALDDFAKSIQEKGLSEAIEWHCGGPLKDDYVDFEGQTADWFQVYETVSKGTPVTPPFATEDELVDYLATYGDFWDQSRGDGPWRRENAERFVKGHGFAPSLIIENSEVKGPKDQ